MANIKSAIKRIDVTKRQTLKNRAKKSELKTLTKKFDLAVEESRLEDATNLLKVLDKKLKKAVSKSVLHKNAASRRLSKLSSKLGKAKA
ncbi:30S ribosomal protein S20 [Helcococcus ovis]|uniref:Small ribosomal subunit protein bS20 n=2 Tax=Helcococcus ovis TaxID=72026 RepID=A0A4R9C2G5_9FIRM|nr:30S ribosomal protein S20 [Helcococcus ovis]TFF64814.1 30S ribosomal protein S20 [Helcococcus ovis]TFF65866.1 30S ribosomal protein S20 [Helcococcus ovis]TFF67798.1 30S ribosomal protein S20 [Helcococcus ovis]WNZ01062.1 30S ribosomal protein S20 [Helcococcus ovis]